MDDRLPSGGSFAVVVMGVCGCGKSTVGAALAKTLACPFLEGDEFHAPEAIKLMRGGIPLTDDDRWLWLDRLGLAIGTEAALNGVAVAACSALKKSYRDRLMAAAKTPLRFVFLDADPGELQRRLAGRPDHYMPASLLASQIETLERPQTDEAALTLDGSASSDVLRAQTMAWLRARGRAGGRGGPPYWAPPQGSKI